MNVNVGIDIGSTTVKIVVVRDGEIIHKHYERHFSKVREKAVELVRAARGLIGEDTPLRCSITGSAGLGVAKAADIDFVQEVFATGEVVRRARSAGRCCHRAGRRGREDHLLHRRRWRSA